MNSTTSINEWEQKFQTWKKPLSETEDEQCRNAERAVKNAIAKNDALKNKDIKIFVQGSYGENTNVRRNSDIDLCVLCPVPFYPNYPDGMDNSDFGNSPSKYSYAELKNEVEQALKNHFGNSDVHRGDKAINISENNFRINADVLPCFGYRNYKKNGKYVEGVGFKSDSGNLIISFPVQNKENGINKNDRTGKRFKKIVRILKRLQAEMAENGVTSASRISSFLIYCFAWNAPDEDFQQETYANSIRLILAHVWNKTKEDSTCSEWREINGQRILFNSSQPQAREEVHQFCYDAWNYLGFN